MTTRKFPKSAFTFLASAALEKPADSSADSDRAFSGVAYNGGIITDHWLSPCAFDLASMKIETPIPVLEGHSHDDTIGVLNAAVIGSDVRVSGNLFCSIDEDAKAIAAKADRGFPWQLSIGMFASSIEEVSAGAEYELNGNIVTGPLRVFRGARVREVSFCAVAADSMTSAAVFSGDPPDELELEVITMADKPKNEQQDDPRIAELESKLTELQTQFKASVDAEKARADAALAELETVKTAARKKDIEALFSAQGREWDDEKAKPYFAMSPETFSAVTADFAAMKEKTDKLNPLLFTSVATGGKEQPDLYDLNRGMLADYNAGGPKTQ